MTVTQRHLRARIVIGLTGALLALSAVGGGIAVAADHAVAISGFSFSPKDITINVGDTVTWTNSDAQGHTATADGGSFDTGTIGNGTSKTVTFSTAGTFAYHCSIHAAMIGGVTVQAAAAGATNPPTDTAGVALAASPSPGLVGAGIVLAGAFLVGLLVARRRFARP